MQLHVSFILLEIFFLSAPFMPFNVAAICHLLLFVAMRLEVNIDTTIFVLVSHRTKEIINCQMLQRIQSQMKVLANGMPFFHIFSMHFLTSVSSIQSINFIPFRSFVQLGWKISNRWYSINHWHSAIFIFILNHTYDTCTVQLREYFVQIYFFSFIHT